MLTGESKHCKSYPSEGMLDSFKRQTVVENENAMQDGGLLFVNNTGKSINRMDVWMQKSTYLKLHGADRLLEREDLTDSVRRNIEGLLVDGEFDWLRLTLLAVGVERPVHAIDSLADSVGVSAVPCLAQLLGCFHEAGTEHEHVGLSSLLVTLPCLGAVQLGA